MISVLLLHGFCLDHTIWKSVLETLKDTDINFIVPDIPGFGETSPPEEFSIPQFSDHIYSLIIQQKIDKFYFLGHSLGGYIALDFASKYQDKLLGLGLIHSHPFADSDERKQIRKNAISLIQSKGTYLYLKQMLFSLFTKEFLNNNPLIPEKLLSNALKIEPSIIMGTLQAMIDRRDYSKILTTLQIPYLFFNGKNDPVIPLHMAEDYIKLSNPDLTINVLDENSAHMSMFESPNHLAISIKSLILDY